MFAGEVTAQRALGQDHTAGRCTRAQARLAERQATGRHFGQSVDILVGVDLLDRRISIETLGQRQLQQDVIDALIGIQGCNQGLDIGLAGRIRQAVVHGDHANLLGLAHLVAHIDLARRVFPHKDHSQ